MRDKTKKHVNIPIFIPHLGCPNTCVFCNQRSISGRQEFECSSVIDEIEEALDTIPSDYEVEIAYFGGSFTGIDRSLMIYLLDVAKKYIDREDDGRARVMGIRMSTRPDYISGEIMEILSNYPIKTVELGLQSMDDGVLMRSKRGHSASDAERACKMIKDAGYKPMVYASRRMAYFKFDLSRLKDYDFWLAEYSDEPTMYYNFDMWQYSCEGQIDGIEGEIDMNICFKDYSKEEEEAPPEETTVTTTAPETTTAEETSQSTE